MVNEVECRPNRSGDVYFVNNEQALIAVFTAAFCFTHAKHNLIKHKFY